MKSSYDAVVIGSGMGGSVITRRLVEAGFEVCLLERGDFIPQEKANWDIAEIAVNKRYRADETWYDGRGRPFSPRAFYNVGGASKFYGGSAFRLRREDFEEQRYTDGTSPAWPYPYDELSPWYDQAEELLKIRGRRGEDPTDPGGAEYPAEAVEHEDEIARLAERLAKQGLHPFHTPLAVDFGPGGRCRKGSPCDGFPCMVRAKGDAENRILRPVYTKKPANLTLLTKAKALRILADPEGRRVRSVEFEHEGITKEVAARIVVLSAGAIQSALLLLDSRLADSSGLVGRNYLCHNNSVLIAFNPFRRNPTRLQKTLSVNDYYLPRDEKSAAGNIQMRGKIHPEMLISHPNPLVRLLRNFIAPRSLDFWIMSEDLPTRENRVYRDGKGRIRIERRPTRKTAHRRLVRRLKRHLRIAGYPFCFVTRRGAESIQHQCGTLRMGNDPSTSVLDGHCRSHDHPNLYVVDGSFFPSSGAVNPALTIVAQALKVADRLIAEISGPI